MNISKLEREFERGGFLFWVSTSLAAVGFYGALWLMMAVGVMLT